jgi:hypothetical protein
LIGVKRSGTEMQDKERQERSGIEESRKEGNGEEWK